MPTSTRIDVNIADRSLRHRGAPGPGAGTGLDTGAQAGTGTGTGTGTHGGMATRLGPNESPTSSVQGRHWAFGEVSVSDLELAPGRVNPSLLDATSRIRSRLSVIFLRAGDFTVEYAERQLRFIDGSAAYLAEPTHVEAWSAVTSHVTIVSLPRQMLQFRPDSRSRGSHAPDFHTHTAPAPTFPAHDFGAFAYSATVKSPTLSFVVALMDVVNEHSIPAEPTATVLTQLVGGLFEDDERSDTPARVSDLGLRAHAESLIALGSARPSFNSRSVASQLALTLAQLEAGFRRTGARTSPADAIRDRRAMMAMLGMQSPGDSPMTPESAALHAGFSNVRDLQRAIKTAYGTTVKEILLGQVPGEE
ncbi:hypothetical protein [Subtercola frigoramans]|uniref:HTH araC/xylS-type domain-containing protein n=1 Tax=Subtercola frigoramans TaxID=120298 RepID=A0ABS2L3H5_9MICO|nr:hypothetical protein [Subtercola frigoramans]MBM7471656.1 hypothetical protein [Subtercola frigoramans]